MLGLLTLCAGLIPRTFCMEPSIFNPGEPHKSVESKIAVSLERVAEAFRVLLWNEAKGHGLTPIQMQLLIFLAFHPEKQRKVSYLAQEFNLTKATISDAVKILLQKGLVMKADDLSDSRSYSLYLTPKGEELAHTTSHFADSLQAPLEKLTVKQKEVFYEALLTLIHTLTKSGIITHQRMCYTCRFYAKSKDGAYCNLLQKPLPVEALRVDCPEHELIAR